jgi:hypothetical protein
MANFWPVRKSSKAETPVGQPPQSSPHPETWTKSGSAPRRNNSASAPVRILSPVEVCHIRENFPVLSQRRRLSRKFKSHSEHFVPFHFKESIPTKEKSLRNFRSQRPPVMASSGVFCRDVSHLFASAERWPRRENSSKEVDGFQLSPREDAPENTRARPDQIES